MIRKLTAEEVARWRREVPAEIEHLARAVRDSASASDVLRSAYESLRGSLPAGAATHFARLAELVVTGWGCAESLAAALRIAELVCADLDAAGRRVVRGSVAEIALFGSGIVTFGAWVRAVAQRATELVEAEPQPGPAPVAMQAGMTDVGGGKAA